MLIPNIEDIKTHAQHRTEQYIKKHYPDFYQIVLLYVGDVFIEKLYNYYFPIRHKCPCGNVTKFENFNKGYRPYCCQRCASVYTREKSKQVCLERYGVEVPIQNKSIKEKIEKTCIERYGTKKPLSNAEILHKARQTYKNTCKKKYGVETPFHSEIVQQQARKTKLERYGTLTPNSTFTNNNPSLNEELLKKSKFNKQLHFIKKYDLSGYTEDGQWIMKCSNPKCEKCQHKTFIISSGMYHDRLKTGAELCTTLNPAGSYSQTRQEIFIQTLLTDFNVEFITHDRTLISPMELDIYIPKLNLAIECNGIYWHSIEQKPDKYYHFNKLKSCYNKGVRLVSIWEHWPESQVQEIIKSAIKGDEPSSRIIYELYGDTKKHFDICVWDGKTPVIKKMHHGVHAYFDCGQSRY